MENKRLIALLADLGLSEHEAGVYLAALHLGPTTILKIAYAAKIKRTTVYSVVESLITKGLMNKTIKGFKNFLEAQPPDKLEIILDQRKELLNKIMPELQGLHNLKGEESTIKFYEGLNGVKTVYESLLKDIKPHEDYLIISHIEPWLNLDNEFFLDFTRRRAKLPINIRLLLQDSSTAREHKAKQKIYNEVIKILPPNTALDTNLVIIPKKIVIHQLTPPIMAIVIENQSAVKLHQQLFEIVWQSIT